MPLSPKARATGLPAWGSPVSLHRSSSATQSIFLCHPSHPLTGPGKRRRPLYEVPMSGTSRRCGIWRMNHSQSWEINYSSQRKTKHFTDCPGRNELGRGWKKGQTSGGRPALFVKGKGARSESLVWCDQSTAPLLASGLSLCWFIL